VRELCERAFAHAGLDWRAHVAEEAGDFRPSETVPLVGDATRARTRLGWAPSVDFSSLIAMMVDAELSEGE
jgi:GDPmannose 4,6-dehydratase